MSTKFNTNKDLNKNENKTKKNNNSVIQSCRTNKYMKIVKKEKDDKKLLKSVKVKKFEVKDDSADELDENIPVGRKRGLSCTKRNQKSKYS